jgi:hypothetical protein
MFIDIKQIRFIVEKLGTGWPSFSTVAWIDSGESILFNDHTGV